MQCPLVKISPSQRLRRHLDIKIQADSVDTGSGMKNSKLKGKDFFDNEEKSLDHIQVNEDCTDGS